MSEFIDEKCLIQFAMQWENPAINSTVADTMKELRQCDELIALNASNRNRQTERK